MTNEIFHYGKPRRSGRYPWGSGSRPFQSYKGISGYIRKKKQEKADAAEQRERNEQLRIAMEEEQKKRHHDADKERVLRKGTATEVLKYQGELTNQELQNAVNRLTLESNLRNLSQKETKSAIDKVDEIMKTVKTGTEWAKIGTDTYNTLAAIYNATPEGQRKPLTLVGKGDGGKKK
nr:MAG TPA: RNA dependent RNA polymerase [Caudoviricetes sp.]